MCNPIYITKNYNRVSSDTIIYFSTDTDMCTIITQTSKARSSFTVAVSYNVYVYIKLLKDTKDAWLILIMKEIALCTCTIPFLYTRV